MKSLIAAMFCVPLLISCGSSSSAEIVSTGKTAEISITNFVFTVPENVMQGDLVRLKNNDAQAHNFMPLDDSFSIDVAAGETVDLPLLEKGTYQFHCHIHPDMMGTLVIN